MNLFRSKEHAQNWERTGSGSMILSIDQIVAIENSRLARERLSPTYLSDLGQILKEARESGYE